MLSLLSAEFLLNNRSNSGAVVFVRSFWTATLIYIATILLKISIDPHPEIALNISQIRTEVAATLPWLGAIFAGAYVALYTRFASQWSYLAGIYNDMMSAAVQMAPADPGALSALHLWQAGFIEDADDLHLAQQPVFAAVIKGVLLKPEVRSNFVQHSSGGQARLDRIEAQIAVALVAAARQRA